ncbi:UNVERIFIED_CONTAM: hypothetical protein Sindi_1968700, partial [Sesamum indicum]
ANRYNPNSESALEFLAKTLPTGCWADILAPKACQRKIRKRGMFYVPCLPLDVLVPTLTIKSGNKKHQMNIIRAM